MASVLILNATLPPSAVITVRGCLASVALLCARRGSHMPLCAARATGASGPATQRRVGRSLGAGWGPARAAVSR